MSNPNKYCYIDTEFNGTAEERLNVVSCSYEVEGRRTTYWVHNDMAKQEVLRKDLIKLHKQGCTFVAYNVSAEARFFYALHLNPKMFKWLDLYLEYRCLTNHNHHLAYGKQLIKGKKKVTSPPTNMWNMTEDEKRKKDFNKPEHGLVAAVYKLLGVETGVDFKNDTRDLIISNKEFSNEEKERILTYNESDIGYLEKLQDKIVGHYQSLLGSSFDRGELEKEMLLRGDYAARTAIMESIGYPINYEATKAFSDSVADILWQAQNEITESFPEIQPFKKKRDRTYRWDQKITRKWIEENHKKWMKTDTGLPSLSLDAFKEHYDYRHNFPSNNFGAQMVRYLSLKQNLNGFSPNTKNSFWNSVGTDQRVRPYFGIYGAQSARSQPKATGFLFLKSAWMRGLVSPRPSKVIWGIDYKSQEFLLGALLSGDSNMLKAYHSGDPYLYFAKLAGAVPKDGTKEEYSRERNLFKSTCIRGDCLVRVKFHGYLQIKDIKKGMEVWDGQTWRKCRGAKYMGKKDTLLVEGAHATKDHLILTDSGWVENEFTAKERKGRKIYYKNAERLQRPSASWAEVWELGCYILKTIFKGK